MNFVKDLSISDVLSVPTLASNVSATSTTKQILTEVHSVSPLLYSTIATTVAALTTKVNDIKSYSAQEFIAKAEKRFENTILPLDKWIQARDVDLTVIYTFITDIQSDFDLLPQPDANRLKDQFPELIKLLLITKKIQHYIMSFIHTPIHTIIDLF